MTDFSSVRHSTFTIRNSFRLAPHGMAGFGLVRFWFLVKLKAARVFKRSSNRTPVSVRERRRALMEADLVDGHWSPLGELLAKFGSN